MLRLDLRLPDGASDDPRIMVTGPNGYLFTDFKTLNGTDAGLSVEVPIAKLPRNYDIKGKRWRLLVVSGERAMETTLAFD